MAFGDFGMIQPTGPALAVAIFVTLVAALTLSPALLAIFGHYLFWPLHTRDEAEGEPRGFFAASRAAVSRRPGHRHRRPPRRAARPGPLPAPDADANFDVLAELPGELRRPGRLRAVGAHLGGARSSSRPGSSTAAATATCWRRPRSPGCALMQELRPTPASPASPAS